MRIVPAEMIFVPGSLHVSSGDAKMTSDGNVQTIVWEGTISSQNAVTIRFDLRARPDNVAMDRITLAAETRGKDHEILHHAEVDILLNPHRIHLPHVYEGKDCSIPAEIEPQIFTFSTICANLRM